MNAVLRLTRESRRRQRLPDRMEDSMTVGDVARLLAGGQIEPTPPRAQSEWEVIARRGKRVFIRRRPRMGGHILAWKESNADDAERLYSEDSKRRRSSGVTQ